jgi:hypothetical protein
MNGLVKLTGKKTPAGNKPAPVSLLENQMVPVWRGLE